MIIRRILGRLEVTGSGPHRIRHTDNAAEMAVSIWNNGTGAAAASRLNIGNNTSETHGSLIMTSTGFSPSGTSLADALIVRAFGNGGVVVDSVNGSLKLYSSTGGVAVQNSSVVHSNGGFSASYNGMALVSNLTTFGSGSGATRGTMANTSLPAWCLDIGGTMAGDGAPFQADHLAVFRRATSAGSWTQLLRIGNDGTVTAAKFSTGDIELDNQFVITEHDKVGISEPGVGIKNAAGDLVLFVDRKGILYTRGFARMSDLYSRRHR
jgi:hypothetical protein